MPHGGIFVYSVIVDNIRLLTITTYPQGYLQPARTLVQYPHYKVKQKAWTKKF